MFAGAIDVVNKLLAAGCDVHIKNAKQLPAICSAANAGFLDVVLRLVQVSDLSQFLDGTVTRLVVNCTGERSAQKLFLSGNGWRNA